jgi:hypothetical protein
MLIPFIFFTLVGCSSGQSKLNTQVDTTKAVMTVDTTSVNNINLVDVRKEFIATYSTPIFVDTFFVDNGQQFEAIFHYFSTMDSGLIIPAKYNFDINKDFVTHNFISDLMLLSGKDTLFKKQITKSIFDKLLDSSLKKYATLMYPEFYIKNDSIEIHYSISIPVTDVGIGVNVKFAQNGNYTIKQ